MNRSPSRALVLLLPLALLAAGCVVIEDGEVGVSKSFGTISDEPVARGVVIQIPVVRTVETWNVKLQELKESAHEGWPTNSRPRRICWA